MEFPIPSSFIKLFPSSFLHFISYQSYILLLEFVSHIPPSSRPISLISKHISHLSISLHLTGNSPTIISQLKYLPPKETEYDLCALLPCYNSLLSVFWFPLLLAHYLYLFSSLSNQALPTSTLIS